MNAKSYTKSELVNIVTSLTADNEALRAENAALRTQCDALSADLTAALQNGAGGNKASCSDCTCQKVYASFKEASENARRLAQWARESAPGKYVVTQIGERVIVKLRAGYKAAKAA